MLEGKHVTIKMLKETSSERDAEDLDRELDVLQLLHHPHIVRLAGAGQTPTVRTDFSTWTAYCCRHVSTKSSIYCRLIEKEPSLDTEASVWEGVGAGTEVGMGDWLVNKIIDSLVLTSQPMRHTN